jgi:hypothetical protein
MHLPDVSNSLPPLLRGSNLPWKPVGDHQAPAPRGDDGWRAQIGYFELELDANDYSWCSTNPNPGSLTFELRLIHTLFDRERSSWSFDSLQDAVTAAETSHQLLLDALLLELQHAQEAIRAVA